MRPVTVNGDALTIEEVVDVARGAATAELAPASPPPWSRAGPSLPPR